MDTKYLVWVYAAYAACAITLTVWLARTLYYNGAVFLEEVFEREETQAQPTGEEAKPKSTHGSEIAVSVNRLLVTGFFMINLGYAMFLLKSNSASTPTRAIEVLVQKLGILLLTLAAVHFVNVYVFWRMRRRNEVRHLPPPVAPQRHVPVEV